MSKRFLLHCYKKRNEVESMPFESRQRLVSWLRDHGVTFPNHLLCGIGSGLVKIDGGGSGWLFFEVEEMTGDEPDDIVAVNGRVFVSVSKYCRDTGKSEREVYRAYHLDRKKGHGC